MNHTTIEKYGIVLRPVEIEDAEFIVKLRTHKNKSIFISKSSSEVDKQREWINSYKRREKEGKEYYFIGLNTSKESFATYRIYNIEKNSIEIGSWISDPDYPSYSLDPVKLDVLVKEYVFNKLGYEELKFEVRKENKKVVNYHKRFRSEIVREDELNYYFTLTKTSFLTYSINIKKLFE